MAVLVDRLSASASEIFAGAMQDYGRALIVGEPTFGKGTVQQLIDLDRLLSQNNSPMGQLKVTTAQFFRVSGSSTQHKGVVPDIIFPTLIDGEEYGESALDNALPWARVEPADYEASEHLNALLEAATARHAARIAQDEDFLVLAEDIEYYEQNRDRTSISLLESERQAERDKLEARRAHRNALRTASATGGDSGQTLASAGDSMANAGADSGENPNVAGLDAETSEVTDTPEDALESDFVLDEAARVLGDLIDLMRRNAAVS
jgi:carboxyl-terminal processing protease